MSEDTIENRIRECLARGFCHNNTSGKEVDVSLIESMTEEVMIMLDKELPETVVLTYDTIPKGHTVSELLDMIIIRDGKKWK